MLLLWILNECLISVPVSSCTRMPVAIITLQIMISVFTSKCLAAQERNWHKQIFFNQYLVHAVWLLTCATQRYFFLLSYTKAYVGSAPCKYHPAHTFNPFYSWISTPPRCITQPLLDTEWHHTPHTLADSRLLAPQHPAPSHAGWNCLTSASHTLSAAQEHHLWVVWCYFLLPRQQSS